VKTKILLAAALITLAVPASASARIVPQRGIAGANLDMSRQAVLDALGDPDKQRDRTSSIFGKYMTFFYGRTTVDMFRGGKQRVFNVSTTSKSERTAGGVGVGSSAAAVKKGVRGARCNRQHCFVGHFDPGRKVTDFILSKSGRVTRVTIGYVID
jgi:hypothetical protein